MKRGITMRTYCLAAGILVTGTLLASNGESVEGFHTPAKQTNSSLASNGELVKRYHTLARSTDSVTLAANETAIIVGTVGFDTTYNWMNVLYKQGTNDFVSMALPLGLTGGTMPLSGPGVIMLATNDASIFGAEFTGAVGLKIVRTIQCNAH